MVDLLATYMELDGPPPTISLVQPAGVEIARAFPSRDEYLALYSAIGAPVQWDQRLRMPADELSDLLKQPSTLIFILRVDGRAVGMCEFEGVGGPAVELANFGLLPEVQGKGLGTLLLHTALASVWDHAPERVWLRTDTNDHPKAIATYLRAGFKVVERKMEAFPD